MPVVFYKKWYARLIRFIFERSFNRLKNLSPDKFEARAIKRLIDVVNHVVNHSSVYFKILKSESADTGPIKTIDDFNERIPVIDKEILFNRNSLKDLTLGIKFENIGTIRISSGSSGSYSYQLQPFGYKSTAGIATEYLLKKIFNVPIDNTIIINTLPAGFNIPTFTIPVVVTGTIENHAYATIKKIAGDFKHIVLTGEAPFIKNVLESGTRDGFWWRDHDVFIITGGEYVPENMRNYFSFLLGRNKPDEGRIQLNMGLTELATTVFFETRETVTIRRLAGTNEKLRKLLFTGDTRSIPEIMHYLPHEIYMESIRNQSNRPELVVTLLDKKHQIPIIRYNTKDEVEVMTYRNLQSVLIRCNLEAYLPSFKLPIGIIYGRGKRMTDGLDWFSVNEIKEIIYSDFEIAEIITGAFKIYPENNGSFDVKIQLQDNKKESPDMIERLKFITKSYTLCTIEYKFISFFEFRFGMEFNYGRKFNYYL
ncbi:MAG: hypothetical protein JXB24_02210 [Bacteroidales bacterium]|nr:hypothetical protein [Bacteroidales bacterium]